MIRDKWQRWMNILSRNTRACPARTRKAGSARPRLEFLEGREVPATLTVGVNETFSTINAAIAAAHPGDTIKVDPGTYTEQVVIGKNLNNLKLIGANRQSFIAPAVNSQTAALVEVNGARNVTISGFTVSGPGNGTGSIGYGILVDGGGSATISNNHVTNIRDNPMSGDQNGVGIKVGGSTQGSATISRNTIDNYQKGGIVVNGSGSHATVSHNTVEGAANNTVDPTNGIQFGRGATGTITRNKVSGNVFSGQVTDGELPFEGSLPLAYQGVGILLYQAGKVTVSYNTVNANDIGIWDFASGKGTQIRGNSASFSNFDGIVLEEVVEATLLSNNTARFNEHDGIEFVFDPTGSESGVPDTHHNQHVTLTGNIANRNGNVGVEVESGSTKNVFASNTMLKNTSFDAEDLSAGAVTHSTGNTWMGNLWLKGSPHLLVP
jgi:parallel beta-helix repeat protein